MQRVQHVYSMNQEQAGQHELLEQEAKRQLPKYSRGHPYHRYAKPAAEIQLRIVVLYQQEILRSARQTGQFFDQIPGVDAHAGLVPCDAGAIDEYPHVTPCERGVASSFALRLSNKRRISAAITSVIPPANKYMLTKMLRNPRELRTLHVAMKYLLPRNKVRQTSEMVTKYMKESRRPSHPISTNGRAYMVLTLSCSFTRRGRVAGTASAGTSLLDTKSGNNSSSMYSAGLSVVTRSVMLSCRFER